MRFIIGAGRWTEIGADVHVLAEGKWTGTQGKTPAAEPMLEAEAMSCPDHLCKLWIQVRTNHLVKRAVHLVILAPTAAGPVLGQKSFLDKI